MYKAYDPVIGRDVAIKVIADRLKADPLIKERFKREAHAQGALSHENITIVYDVGEESNRPFIVMEYLEGMDLHSLMKLEAALPLDQKFTIAIQICKGLQYAHSRGVIHRDIKPGNVRILDKNRVKIMDFGLAKPEAHSLTTFGVVMGTPAYMSPEQWLGEKADRRSDVFSFGVLFYELLTSERPFVGEKAQGIKHQVLHEEPPPLALDDCEWLDDLQRVVSRCLEKEKEDRYDDFNAVQADLETLRDKEKAKRIAADLEVTQSQPFGIKQDGRTPWLSPKIVRGVLAVVAVVVFLAVGYLIVTALGNGDFSSGEPDSTAQAQSNVGNSHSSDTRIDSSSQVPPDSIAQPPGPPIEPEQEDPVFPEEEEGTPSDETDTGHTQLQQDVEQARNDMINEKLSVPGQLGDKNKDAHYQQALALEATAEQQMEAGVLNSALVTLHQAKERYNEAVLSITETLKSNADQARDAMTASKQQIGTEYHTRDTYKQALQAESAGDSAYVAGTFSEAYTQYQQARSLFTDILLEEAEATRGLEAVRKATQDVRTVFKESIEQEDITRLGSLYQTFSEDEQEKWSNLFKFFEILNVSAAEEQVDLITEHEARLDLVFVIEYRDNKNRKQIQNYTYTWTLGQVEGAWKITSFTAR